MPVKIIFVLVLIFAAIVVLVRSAEMAVDEGKPIYAAFGGISVAAILLIILYITEQGSS
jgi:hypothetical protein